MAKPTVQTSRKRVNKKKEELKAPDEVTTQLQRLSDHLSKHIRLYVIGLAALLVVALVITWLVEWRSRRKVEKAQALTDAVAVITGSVGAYAESEQGPQTGDAPAPAKPDFATEADRWKAAEEKVNAAKSEVSSDAEPVLNALAGRVALAQKKYDDAGKAFDAFLEKSDKSTLTPIVLESRGMAAQAAGDVAAAAGFYEKLAASSDLYFKVRGQMLLGDLYSGPGGDKAKAQEHYAGALSSLVPGEGQVLPASLRALRGEINRRQAQL